MTDIILESVRAFIVGLIVLYLLLTGRREELRTQKGWPCILTGFVLLLFGMIIDLMDNFPALNKYIIISDTGYKAFLEKAVGYLGGVILLAIGFRKWIPTVIALKKTERSLEESRDELELIIEKRMADLITINNELEEEIARRYRTEKELKYSKEYFCSLIENAMDIITVVDNEGIIQFASPSVEKVLGYKPEELVGTHVLNFVHTEDRTKAFEALTRGITIPGHSESIEIRYCYKNGSWRTLGVIGKNFSTGSGVTRIILNIRDITDRNKAEQAILESEEKFRSISASAKDAIIMMDVEGNISYWNKAAEKIFGYTQDEVMGKEMHMFLSPERFHDAHKKRHDRFRETGEGAAVGKTLELAAVRKDGTEFPIELSVSSVKIKGQWNAIGILRDISERKRMEQERERLIEKLKEALSEVKTLSGMLPICSSCKKIRNDKGYWEQVDVYIHDHSEAEFSHGMCPECAKTLYPQYFKDET